MKIKLTSPETVKDIRFKAKLACWEKEAEKRLFFVEIPNRYFIVHLKKEANWL